MSPPTSLSGIAKTSIPSFSSPSVSISAGGNPLSLSSIAKSGNIPTSLSGIGSSLNVPTSLSGAVSNLGIPTTAGGISSAFGGPTSLSGALSSAGVQLPNFASAVTLPPLNLPKMVNFPGLDAPGIALGAGPKFLAEKVAKLKTIVPPFVPGLKLNMGMIVGALAVIKAMASANPSELLKQITQNILDDLKDQVGDVANQALDSTGVSGIQDQLAGIQGSAQGAMDNITGAAQGAIGGATEAVQGAVSTATTATETAASTTATTSGGVANLNLSAVSNPIGNAVSSGTSFVNDKISAFSFPPKG